jgi:16S rRNA (cytosine1402-N4)-methyltransferase
VKIVAATFGEISTVVREHADFLGGDDIVGVLLDLGVSSHQLDDASRGFSFRQNAPLDMRMDASKGSDATSYLRSVSEHDLVHLLRENGEQRFASAIARSLMALQPSTTDELTAAVEKAVPAAARRRGHVATRVFQALRIAVNDEVEELAAVLPAALGVLSTGGKLVVISYHSGEDRAVKHFFAEEAKGGCQCPVHLPCVCGATPRVTLAKASAIMPTEEEVLENPRARSARLRMATKVA